MIRKPTDPGAYRLRDISHLKALFPDGHADEMNFCLFSTSGVHGTYDKIEDLFSHDEELLINKITVLVVRPRVVQLLYGHIKVEKEDIEYLKKLRESSHEVVQSIGISVPSMLPSDEKQDVND